MNLVAYIRVSTEGQAKEEKVSLPQQLKEINQFCDRDGHDLIDVFEDSKKYRATQKPNKGKIVTPSGERADRPGFLAMLERIKQGSVDGIVCWVEDRLVRHPRVNVVLEDTLDPVDSDRKKAGLKPTIIFDAKGAMLDRFTLRIKAVVWQEENKRRVERSLMGKKATLQKGYWPGSYRRLGYTTEKTPNGNKIIKGENEDIETVQLIFDLADRGFDKGTIRRRLIADGRRQVGHSNPNKQKYEWGKRAIFNILTTKDYTGVATWNHREENIEVPIPQLITNRQFNAVQKRLKDNRFFKSRSPDKPVGMLDGLLFCGGCGCYVRNRTLDYRMTKQKDGSYKKHFVNPPRYNYRCSAMSQITVKDHPKPSNWTGDALDSQVWQFLVENVIVNREMFIEQVKLQQQQLEQNDKEIQDRVRRYKIRLAGLSEQELTLGRKLAQGRMSEDVYDALIDELHQTRGDVREQLDYYTLLSENRKTLQTSRETAARLLEERVA